MIFCIYLVPPIWAAVCSSVPYIYTVVGGGSERGAGSRSSGSRWLGLVGFDLVWFGLIWFGLVWVCGT